MLIFLIIILKAKRYDLAKINIAILNFGFHFELNKDKDRLSLIEDKGKLRKRNILLKSENFKLQLRSVLFLIVVLLSLYLNKREISIKKSEELKEDGSSID